MRSENDASLVYDIRSDIRLGDKAADGAQLRPHIVWFGEPVVEIERAIRQAATADIFIVIGTSLQVYPAAGLLDHVPDHAVVFLIDKSIPENLTRKGVQVIEKAATEGVGILLTHLL